MLKKLSLLSTISLISIGLLAGCDPGGGDTIAPTITISTPANGVLNEEIVIEYEISDNVSLLENIEVNVSVTLNEEEIALDNDYAFVPVVEGIYHVSVSATDEANNRGNQTLDISVVEIIELHTTKLVTYGGPSIMTSSSLVDIAVEGESLFVYETRVNLRRSFSFAYPTTVVPVSYFDFEGEVDVAIKLNYDIETLSSAKVTPLSLGVVPTIDAASKTINFTLRQPANYTIEFNEQTNDVIHLFANPLETEEEKIDPNNIPEDVIYIGPGAYETGPIPMESGQTLYIAGGAYVYGQVRTAFSENITIRGRGIMAGDIYSRQSEAQYTLPFEAQNAQGITLKDVIMLDPAGWAVTLYNCDNILIDNLKIMTARANGDGISVQGSRNTRIQNCFVRTYDDAVTIKCNDGYNVDGVECVNNVFWNDLAQSMEIGYETRGDYLRNVSFRDNTVLHNFHKPVMSIHLCEDADVSNISFSNITVEDGQMLNDVSVSNTGVVNDANTEDNFFIDLDIRTNAEWSDPALGGVLGTIRNVSFDNIKVLKVAETVTSRMFGRSNSYNIDGVTISNLDYAGVAVEEADDFNLFTNEYASNIRFNGTTLDEVDGADPLSYSNYVFANDFDDVVSKTVVQTVYQEAMIVPDFLHAQGDIPFAGDPLSNDIVTPGVFHGTGTNASNTTWDETASYAKDEAPAANLLDGDLDTVMETKPWNNEPNELVVIKLDFSEPVTFGSLRVIGERDNKYAFDLMVEYRLKTTATGNYVSQGAAIRGRIISPLSNNYFDIPVGVREYYGAMIIIRHTFDSKSMQDIKLSEIELHAPSLTFRKAIVDSTPHEDVYTASNLVDGSDATYYETNRSDMPAHVVIDLGTLVELRIIMLHLNPAATWDPRVQEIEILGSNAETAYNLSSPPPFETLVAKTGYAFDPNTGNMVMIELASPVTIRYLKLVIYSNSNAGGYGAQLSEIKAF